MAIDLATGEVPLLPEAESRSARAHRLLLDYSDVEFAKAILEKIADDPTLTIDNDFGTILSGTEFAARIRAEKGWDWRR